jgi:hypothetical protein
MSAELKARNDDYSLEIKASSIVPAPTSLTTQVKEKIIVHRPLPGGNYKLFEVWVDRKRNIKVTSEYVSLPDDLSDHLKSEILAEERSKMSESMFKMLQNREDSSPILKLACEAFWGAPIPFIPIVEVRTVRLRNFVVF